MFYNYEEIFVCMLLVPVVLNLILPLAMLAVWLLKQLVVGMLKQTKRGDAGSGTQAPITT